MAEHDNPTRPVRRDRLRRDKDTWNAVISLVLGVTMAVAIGVIFFTYTPAERTDGVGSGVEAPNTTTVPRSPTPASTPPEK